jgi:UDP-glucose 4-epimerase
MATSPEEPADSLHVLVTGGAGFIGSHVVDRLLAAGHRPRIFDLRRSPFHPPREVPAVRGDVCDRERLCRVMRDCDAVIHLAASADVAEVQATPAEAEERNARGTFNVLEAARLTGVRRVVYASTVWVYSDTQAGVLEESVPLCPPAHLYTATKLAGELYCHAYQELYGVDYTILRFGIPYGPRARPAAVIPAFVSRALAGEPLTVAGDGLQSRRFVYVEDLADGVVRALAPVAANRVYNLVGDEDVTVAQVAQTVRELVGDVPVVHVPGRAADLCRTSVSGEKAAAELDWRPRTPFREGVRRYIGWHVAASGPASPARRAALPAVAALLRRAVLASAIAALAALLVLGLAALVPIDSDMDTHDTFAGMLLLLAPLVLAGGFRWDVRSAGWMRAACWTEVAAALLALGVPWPPAVARLADAHPVFLVLLALSAGIAALSLGSAPWLNAWAAAED